MEDELENQFMRLWDQVMVQAELMLTAPRLYQIGILVLCIGLAWGLNRWLGPKLRAWMHTLEGRPRP